MAVALGCGLNKRESGDETRRELLGMDGWLVGRKGGSKVPETRVTGCWTGTVGSDVIGCWAQFA